VLERSRNSAGADSEKQPAVSITFSGIDGAGKSTQVDLLCADVTGAGGRVNRLSFWEDVVIFPRLREYSSHRLFKGEKGVGSPDRPVGRRDKNVSSWYLTPIRLFLYLLDALNLHFVLRRRVSAEADAVVFDRYIYDELANLRLRNPLVRICVHLLLMLAPTPDLAYLLDAEPTQAVGRKPEYPLEFVHSNRQNYLALSKLGSGIKVIGPGSVPEVREEILKHLLRLHTMKLGWSFLITFPPAPPAAKSRTPLL